MQPISLTDKTRETIGIVLAGNSNLHLWPSSRVNEPTQFKRADNGAPTRFQRALTSITGVATDRPVLVTVSAACLNMAREQIAELDLARQPHLIVEPVERGDPAGLLAALIVAAGSNRNACAITMDANQPPIDEQGFQRLLNQFITDDVWERHPVLGCTLAVSNDQLDRTIQVGQPIGNNHLFRPAGAGTSRKHSVNADPALILITPRLGLQICRKIVPSLLNTISASLQAARETNATTWPDTNLWSALPHTDMMSVLAKPETTALIRPIDFTSRSVVAETPKDSFHLIDNGHLLIVSGCPEIEVVSSPDATLIRSANHAFDATAIIDTLRNTSRPELQEPKTRHHHWGLETVQERGKGYSILRLEISPGRKVKSHFHNHRTENWNVLSGAGSAVLDHKRMRLEPGSIVEIPKNAVHGLTNDGSEPLVLLEVRQGAFLSPVDHIETARPRTPHLSVA